jgi:hypothetical protein
LKNSGELLRIALARFGAGAGAGVGVFGFFRCGVFNFSGAGVFLGAVFLTSPVIFYTRLFSKFQRKKVVFVVSILS